MQERVSLAQCAHACDLCPHPQVMAAKRRYEIGLQKLEFTEQQVSVMQGELIELQPKLIE